MHWADRARSLEQLRSIPLPAILLASGAEHDPHDKNRWKTSRGTISITGTKFFNWSQDVGGGGGIDLAMHLHQTGFKDAVAWLASTFPCSFPPTPPVARPSPRPSFYLPAKDPANLAVVRRYLVDWRRLPAALVDDLLRTGSLYADGRANAVFLLLGKEKVPVGAELRGTTSRQWRGMAPGSSRDLGYFSCGTSAPAEIVLCESAIDAISCATLGPHRLCISTSGVRGNPPWLPDLLDRDIPVYCGFDADPPGDSAAQAMMALYPAIHRLRPPAHDWNHVLQGAQ